MGIDTDLDGGSILVLDASDPSRIELALRPDNAASFMQWFHFRVRHGRHARRAPTALRIVNAGEASYPSGWEGYRACASYDGERWFRVPTDYDGAVLTILHAAKRREVRYACFAPYPSERDELLLEAAAAAPRARVEVVGESLDGRPMNVIALGEDGPSKLRVWIIARQHPGEAMAGWFMEGALLRLLDDEDPVAAELLDRAVVRCVPSMNPDGCARGNHRTNAAGCDLNRSWLAPSAEDSPEVLAVRAALLDGGVDLFLDIHGDEGIPYVFAAGCEGNPGYSPRLERLEELFQESLAHRHVGFQRRYGYEFDEPGEGDLSMAANYVGERFGCLSMTLEMPFKDDDDHPDEDAGWSPERSRGFGEATLESVVDLLDEIG